MDHSAGTAPFTRQIDRAAITNYVLGAIVPLVALAFVVDVYVLPELENRQQSAALIGAVISIGVLSLGAFITLRQVTRRTIRRIDEDNARLEVLLSAAVVTSCMKFSDWFQEGTKMELTKTTMNLVRSTPILLLWVFEELCAIRNVRK